MSPARPRLFAAGIFAGVALVGVALVGVAMLFAGACVPTPESRGVTILGFPLPADDPTVIQAGRLYTHGFRARRGWLIHAVVEQRGIDVALRLRAPNGEITAEIDSPSGIYGTEQLWETVGESGKHQLELSIVGGTRGRVSLRLELSRPSTDGSAARLVDADRAYRRALDVSSGQSGSPGLVDELEEALAVFETAGSRSRRADVLHRLCRAHERAGDWKSALGACEAALELYRGLDDPISEAMCLYRRAELSLKAGQSRQALDGFREARDHFEALGRRRDVALSLRQIGDVLHRLGELRSAGEHLDQALSLEAALSDDALAGIHVSRGSVFLSLQHTEEAETHFREAERLYRRLGNPRKLAIATLRLAWVDSRRGRLASARERLEEVVAVLEPEAPDDPRAFEELQSARIYLGRIHARQGDSTTAERIFSDLLKAPRRAVDPQSAGVALLELATLDVQSGEPARALRRLAEASRELRRADEVQGLALAETRAAEAHRALGRLDEAWRHLEPALDLVETLREEPRRADLRIQYFAFRQDFYDSAVQILMERCRPTNDEACWANALAIHDRRTARQLLDAVSTPGTGNGYGLEVEEIERRLRESLTEPSAAGIGPEDLLRRLYRARAASGPRTPDAAPAPLDAASLGKLTADSQSLGLVYFLGRRKSYLWAVSASGIMAYPLAPRHEIERAAETFRRAVVHLREERRSARIRAAESLGRLLLPADLPREPTRWIIVPSGPLHRIPFAALHRPGDDEPLIHSREIVVVPSLSVLDRLRHAACEREAPGDGITVFADPVSSSTDERLVGRQTPEPENPAVSRRLRSIAESFGLDPLQRLEHSREEAEAVRRTASGSDVRILLGFDADREAFLESAERPARILHVAGHAFQHPEHPELSGLSLSSYDPSGTPRDGFVPSFEIERLSLPRDLVVLSACETGVGRRARGEGMLSLNRSFFQAGARRVIASLWSVEDRSTARLMAAFYRAHLEEKLPASTALRHAQLEMLADPETAKPFHWAGFVFHGDWLEGEAQAEICSQNEME